MSEKDKLLYTRQEAAALLRISQSYLDKLTRAGKISRLGAIQERNLWFAGLGVEWRHWEKLHLKFQLDSHAALADSRLAQIGDPAFQLSAGASWLFAPRWELDVSFIEDIAVDTAADFVLQLGLRYR